MIRNKQKYAWSLLYIILFMGLTSTFTATMNSCSSDRTVGIIEDEKEIYKSKYAMTLGGQKPNFQDRSTRSSLQSDHQWEVGDTLFIDIKHPDGELASTKGIATISPVTGEWEIEFFKHYNAPLNGPATCYVWYVKGEHKQTGYADWQLFVNTTPQTAIYADRNARYFFANNVFTLIADLKPQTGRIRFISKEKTEIKVKGIQRVNAITCWADQIYDDFQCQKGLILDNSDYPSQPLTVAVDKLEDNGLYSSEYVYGFLHKDYDEFSILNLASPDIVYSRKASTKEQFLEIGSSGYLEVPSVDKHEGWSVKDNYIRTIADEVNITKVYEVAEFFLGQVTGYGVRCNVNLSSDHAWLKIRANGKDANSKVDIWSSYPDYEGRFQGTLSLTIPFSSSFTQNRTIIFEHYYSPNGTTQKFTNVKLYYFPY